MSTSVPPHRGSTPPFAEATVADFTHPGVVSCPPDALLATVADIMATHGVHAVVIGGISDNHLLCGAISDLDLIRVAPDGIRGRRATEISAGPAVTVELDTRLEEAAVAMTERRITHLVVVADERSVGVLSTLDPARAIAWAGR